MERRKNKIAYSLTCYIKEHLSARFSMLAVYIVNRYMRYTIDAIIYGYIINIPNIIKFSFVKIPVGDFKLYNAYYFTSNLTSDWLFFIDIDSRFIRKYKMKYVPIKEVTEKVQNFINSEKVYELIR